MRTEATFVLFLLPGSLTFTLLTMNCVMQTGVIAEVGEDMVVDRWKLVCLASAS